MLQSSTHRRSREVRLGIVMYGGVSLAVYICGVAQELFGAVRGKDGYRFIKALTDSDVVVDVISGSSAGGINGIMLAYALCNDRDFASASALWREHGDIRLLLHNPTTPPERCTSLLDSDGFYQKHLEEAFENMPEYREANRDYDSTTSELDLFVTGTDVDGTISTRIDDAGHPITVRNHRSVFVLKHRADRSTKQQLTPGYATKPILHTALAKLSRITSCFPAAFAPVYVSNTKDTDGKRTVDGLLQEWGNLGKDASFLDGGVIDNKPFSYTIGAIFSRTANREVNRKLLYVEPDPEVFAQREEASRPNMAQAVLSSLIGIPGYESISGDLNDIAERNSKLSRYNMLVNKLFAASKKTRRTKSAEFNGFGATSADTSFPSHSELYTRCRLISIGDRILAGIMSNDGTALHIEAESRDQASQLVQNIMTNLLSSASSDNGAALCNDLDIGFRLRRLYRMVYYIYALLTEPESKIDPHVAMRCHALRLVLNKQIELYEIVRSAMETLLDKKTFPLPWTEDGKNMDGDQLWNMVETMLYQLLDDMPPMTFLTDDELNAIITDTSEWEVKAGKWLPQSRLAKCNAELSNRKNEILAGKVPPPEERTSVLRRLERYEQALVEHFVGDLQPDVRRAYDTFEQLDEVMFPIELTADLHEKDIIETVRVSPRDARRGFSNRDYNDKVSGDTLYHFGAFFKRSWRSNDILWGRLDAACQLSEILFDRERIEQLVGNNTTRTLIRNRFFADYTEKKMHEQLNPAVLFPNAGANTHRALCDWLHKLLSETNDDRASALEPRMFDSILTLLVEAEQLEIIKCSMPNVIQDAVEEQFGQHAVSVENTDHPDPLYNDSTIPWVYKHPGVKLDKLVAAAVAFFRASTMQNLHSFSRDTASPATPLQTHTGSFFRNNYRVGSESITRDIPSLALLELVIAAMLVFRNCVLNMLGDKAASLKSHPLYRFGIDYPLRAMHSAVLLMQYYPAWTIPLLVWLFIMSVLTLVVGTIWWRELWWRTSWWSDGSFQGWSFVIFIAVPLALIVLQFVFLLMVYPRIRIKRSK